MHCYNYHLDLFPDDIHYAPLNLVVVDTCLPQSFSAAGVSDLMTGKLSVVIMTSEWGSGLAMWWIRVGIDIVSPGCQ